jgi:tRNA modification GTPase
MEAVGVRRAKARAAGADLVIAAAPPGEDFPHIPKGIASLFLRTKSDLAPVQTVELAVSALNGAGMPQLRAALAQAAAELTDLKGSAALSRPRQVACVRDTAEALGRALALPEPELRGEELRAAANALSRLTGVIGVEAILDAVFSGFCIGK